MIKVIQLCLSRVGAQFRFVEAALLVFIVWRSLQPSDSRWCQSTSNEDFLFGLVSCLFLGSGLWDGRSQRTRSFSHGLIWSRKSRPEVGAGRVHEGLPGARRNLCDLFCLLRPGRLVWACGLMADTQCVSCEVRQCPRSLTATMLDAFDLPCIINLFSQKKEMLAGNGMLRR